MTYWPMRTIIGSQPFRAPRCRKSISPGAKGGSPQPPLFFGMGSMVRAMPYVYQEYPKWIAGPEVIVQNAAEERCIRWQWSRDIGRAKANALQCSRADALALALAPAILALRARGSSY